VLKLKDNKVFKNSLLISLGLLLGRGVGYVRELIIAHKYGADTFSDNLILALTLPELMSNILATGLAVKIIIPRLQGMNEEGVSDFLNASWRKILKLSFIGFLIFNAFSLMHFSWSVFTILALSSVAIFPNAMSATAGAFLTFKEKFLSQSTSNVVFNIVATASIFFAHTLPLITLGFLLASITRFWWVWREASKHSVSMKVFKFWGRNEGDHQLESKAIFYSLFGGSIILINPIINRLAATNLNAGTVSLLSYAEKLYLLPLTIFITPYVMASFPSLSKMIGTEKKLMSVAWKRIYPAIGVSTLIAIFCYFLSPFIVKYSYGFTSLAGISLDLIQKTFIGYLPSLVFSSCSLILTNILFAAKQEKWVFISAMFSVVLNIIGNWAVVYLHGTIVELAYVTSMVSFIVFGLQVFSLIRIEKGN
jgi:putative peptidoglycan lipid II flippase